MYACIHKSEPDFSRGCTGWRIGHSLFTTHLHYPFIRESFYASTVSGDSRRSKSLFTAPIFCSRILHYVHPGGGPSGITPV
jgi:hypothetical protein